MKIKRVTCDLARKVLDLVDRGLADGIGVGKPGQMCVEQVVSYVMSGFRNYAPSDHPTCVASSVVAMGIGLNDAGWSSDKARAKGMRRFAIAQLGSAGSLNGIEFGQRADDIFCRKYLPIALRAVATHERINVATRMRALADRCERDGFTGLAGHEQEMWFGSEAATSLKIAITSTANRGSDRGIIPMITSLKNDIWPDIDGFLNDFAEDMVKILIDMNAPGCAFLGLTEEPKT